MNKTLIKITWFWKELKQSLYSENEILKFLSVFCHADIKSYEGSWIIAETDKLASRVQYELRTKFNILSFKVKEVTVPSNSSINFTNYFCKLNIEKTQKQRIYQERLRIKKKATEFEIWKLKVKESIIIAHSNPEIDIISKTIDKYKN